MGLATISAPRLRRSVSSAEEDSHTAKSTGGRFFNGLVTSSAGSVTYLQLWDGGTSGTLVYYVPVGVNSYSGFDFGVNGVTMETSIVVALSTTKTTFTTAGASGWFVVNTD